MLQGHVHCAERVHAQYNGTVVTLPVNEGAGPASQVCMALTAVRYGINHEHHAIANSQPFRQVLVFTIFTKTKHTVWVE